MATAVKKIFGLNLILVFFLILGLALRFYFSSLAYRELVFDMKAYVDLASKALDEFWIADCCAKNPGYPLFLALLFKISGGVNLDFVRAIAVLGDIGAGVLFYVAAKQFFSKTVRNVFFVFYMVNPFTSAMTGLILPDTYSIFLLGILVFVITRSLFTKQAILWFVFGLVLGVMVLTRIQFLYLSLTIGLCIGLFIIKNKRKIPFLLLTISGFLIPSYYTVLANYKTFRTYSITPPHTFQAGVLYLMFYQIRPYPEVVYEGEHEEERRVWMEFAFTPLEQKKEFSEKYYSLFWKKLKTEWPLFLYNWARKSWWIWDKDHIFIYNDPFHPADKWPLRIINIVFLTGFLYGIIKYIKVTGKKVLQSPIFLLTVILFLQITFLYSLVSSEARHSLIFYPFLMIWTAYGIVTSTNKSLTRPSVK